MKEQVDLSLLKEIVLKMKGGDEKARGQFYDLTHGAIYRYCFFLSKNQYEAHDLCHDTYVKAFVNVKGLKDETVALAWLFRISKNTFLDLRKKKKEDQLGEHEIQESSSSSDYVAWIAVRRILQSFDLEDRTILIMVDMEGMSYKETAEAIGQTEDAIRMKLHRLRQDFMIKFTPPETN